MNLNNINSKDIKDVDVEKEYVNYHKHSDYSNIKSLDCITKMTHYCERAKELGHTVLSTVEHGYQGNVFETNTLVKKNGLKMIVGVEAYYVPDRFEKDRRNFHMILIAKNTNGFKDINRIISEANVSGMYYKPRIDKQLLFSVNPDNVIITTACTAGILREDFEDYEFFLYELHSRFKSNLYLEVQSHCHISQIKHNEKVLELSDKYGIEIIHANDSHYIYPQDSKYRDLFLYAKDIKYENEEGFVLDYPSYNEIVYRYKAQGVLTESQIYRALDNTLVFKQCEDIEINDDIKLPKVSDNPKKEFRDILTHEWNKEKKFIPRYRWKEYMEAIRYETSIVDQTNMHQYFILNYKVIKNGVQKYGGVISRTGRGSSPSFYINKLFGLTNIDRLDSPITLYPTRFMSVERILGTRSLPDIDSNLADRGPFIKATQDILGRDGVHWLLTYKPLQNSSAFRLWCKAKDLSFSEYNEVGKNLEDYVDHPYWGEIIKDSERFVGVIESASVSPCSFLLLDKPISEEVGILRVGEEFCANLDGYNCDVYKYLKNDYLSVSVWLIISETCKLIGMKIPTIRELLTLLDSKTFSMYELGLTATLNQADTEFGTECVKRFKPKTIGEMCAFVASIRPGFASLLNNFLDRKPYTTGVKELDDLLEDSYHYLMYQESIMKFLVWLGMPESQTYDIIKKISKKKIKGEELIELKDTLKQGWINHIGNDEGFEQSWQVVDDAAHYSFNASHSLSVALDSLYGAYLKSHYPLQYYTVTLNVYKDDIKKTSKLVSELSYFNIKLEKPKFGYSKAKYFFDETNNVIYKGVGSIKYLNETIADDLYCLYREYDYGFDNFFDVLDALQEVNINSRQLDILIKIGYFSEFGKTGKLIEMNKLYTTFNKKTYKTSNQYAHIIKMFATNYTDKTITGVDNRSLINFLSQGIKDEELPAGQIIKAQHENTGAIDYIDVTKEKDCCVIIELDTKYTPKAKLYRVCDGKVTDVKINSNFYNNNCIKLYDSIKICKVTTKNKKRKVNNEWITLDEVDYFIEYMIA